ncbi:hypothetical protein HG264_16695 [Pseudomonas sp. gcc21]|uniref:hypothetical protein n=1 Tax=Pseudomonas sp. gcc21 TaxID=2726989 RepID=UPI001451E43A|nr:hypothetical protein [Pseudomonas sp. gcc21]QJD60394.1 hypothetical protein HG264_16695 [Pseudomonas sp. gcc21]
MSQNAHSLLLFFEGEQNYRTCLKILRLLEEADSEEARDLGEEWGVDLAAEWDGEWFNQSVAPAHTFIRLNYETATRYELPLELLQQLFEAGLKTACLEIFYDQVGEFAQFFFTEGELVAPDVMFGKQAGLADIVEQEFECDLGNEARHGYQLPATITQLIRQREENEARGKEMLEAMMSLGVASRQTGAHPLELARSALVLRAVGKGLLQAIVFGVLTVLLFKGLWLWVGLTVVLLVLLPLLYVSKVAAVFKDDTDDVGEEALC